MSKPKNKESFTSWFNRQEIKHFTADEFINYFSVNRRGIKNSEPPRDLWVNILPTLHIVDDLRESLGRSIVIISSYRSPAYNAKIDGAAKHSYHKTFQALDIVVAGHSPESVFKKLLAWREAGRFKGGLGKYSSFVHIDTRGANATW